MKSISLLIKPASKRCNIDCSYCFYKDTAKNREVEDYGLMTYESSENLIEKALAFVEGGGVHFAFQGGEPTLIGLQFYRDFVSIVKRKNVKGASISYSLQTNGILLDDEFGIFLREEGFLVGISLDGGEDTHNYYRKDFKGEGTFDDVLKGIEVLKRQKVPFNILTVITKETSKDIEKISDFYLENNLRYLQYIPVIESFSGEKSEYTMGKKEYSKFLDDAFFHYSKSIKEGKYYSERFFDNILGMYLGREPENCMQRGSCSIQFVVEGDGSVYPCDFFVLDDFKLGNINDETLFEIVENKRVMEFLREGSKKNEKCMSCKYIRLCKGGCRRYKEGEVGSGLNKYCDSFYDFFEKTHEKWIELANIVVEKGGLEVEEE